MLSLVLLAVLAPLIGGVTGLVAARWFLLSHVQSAVDQEESPDPFVSAEIDQAAAEWASAQGRPEAAGVMADKLHLLYALGRRRRQP
jgi:hypothetical protein